MDRHERHDRSEQLYERLAIREDKYGVRLSDAEEAAERAEREQYWKRRNVRAALLFWSDAEADAIAAAAMAAGMDAAQFIRAAVHKELADKTCDSRRAALTTA